MHLHMHLKMQMPLRYTADCTSWTVTMMGRSIVAAWATRGLPHVLWFVHVLL
jgi:hypothetical protein